MDLVKKRKRIIDLVSNASAETLELLEEIMSPSSEWWNELSDRQKEMIKEGQEDIDNGRVISQDEMKRRHGL